MAGNRLTPALDAAQRHRRQWPRNSRSSTYQRPAAHGRQEPLRATPFRSLDWLLRRSPKTSATRTPPSDLVRSPKPEARSSKLEARSSKLEVRRSRFAVTKSLDRRTASGVKRLLTTKCVWPSDILGMSCEVRGTATAEYLWARLPMQSDTRNSRCGNCSARWHYHQVGDWGAPIRCALFS